MPKVTWVGVTVVEGGLCLPTRQWSPLCCAPIASPFLVASLGLQAGAEGTEVGALPALALTVCPQSPRSPFPSLPCTKGEGTGQAAFPKLLISVFGRLQPMGATGGRERGEAGMFHPLS